MGLRPNLGVTRIGKLRSRLPEHWLLEQLDRAPRVVSQREHLVELDLRMHAVPLDDPVEPRSGVEGLGGLKRLPLIDTTRPAAFAPDEVLADETVHSSESGCDLVKVLSAGLIVDVRR